MVERILIVDDDENWREYLELRLSKARREIITAKSKDEALGILRRLTFNVVIADLRMDESDTTNIDGLVLLDAIQSQYPNEPIQTILLTGYGSLSIIRDAFKKYKVYDFIEKGSGEYEERLTIAVEGAIQARFANSSGMIFETLRSSVFDENMLELISEIIKSKEWGKQEILDRLRGFILNNIPPTYLLPLSLKVHGPSLIRSDPPAIKLICWSRSIGKGLIILIQLGEQENRLYELLQLNSHNWGLGALELKNDAYFSSAVGELGTMNFNDFENISNTNK